jgi:hypothetical protein
MIVPLVSCKQCFYDEYFYVKTIKKGRKNAPFFKNTGEIITCFAFVQVLSFFLIQA